MQEKFLSNLTLLSYEEDNFNIIYFYNCYTSSFN